MSAEVNPNDNKIAQWEYAGIHPIFGLEGMVVNCIVYLDHVLIREEEKCASFDRKGIDDAAFKAWKRIARKLINKTKG